MSNISQKTGKENVILFLSLLKKHLFSQKNVLIFNQGEKPKTTNH